MTCELGTGGAIYIYMYRVSSYCRRLKEAIENSEVGLLIGKYR